MSLSCIRKIYGASESAPVYHTAIVHTILSQSNLYHSTVFQVKNSTRNQDLRAKNLLMCKYISNRKSHNCCGGVETRSCFGRKHAVAEAKIIGETKSDPW